MVVEVPELRQECGLFGHGLALEPLDIEVAEPTETVEIVEQLVVVLVQLKPDCLAVPLDTQGQT